MEQTIQKYINPISEEVNHRYKSWEHCYTAFENKNAETDLLALHLGFYLASWGMYRGSSVLLQRDYKIHLAAIQIILDNYDLREMVSENILPDLKRAEEVFRKMADSYLKKGITPTDTLISKIILGTLGCMPALDRFFNLGFYKKEYSNIKSFEQIWQFAIDYKPNIESVQEWIKYKTGVFYPLMKIVDMYHWQIGYDIEETKKNVIR